MIGAHLQIDTQYKSYQRTILISSHQTSNIVSSKLLHSLIHGQILTDSVVNLRIA